MFPQHTKYAAASEKILVCGEFLEFLQKKFVFADRPGVLRYAHVFANDLLAEFFGIDQVKLEAEKEAMLAEIRARSAA